MLCAQCNSRAAFKSLLPDMNQQRRRGVHLSSSRRRRLLRINVAVAVFHHRRVCPLARSAFGRNKVSRLLFV